jgi:hypothetical protein
MSGLYTNSFASYEAKGLREQLAEMISDISPQETPFISNGQGKRDNPKGTLFDWQTDKLAAAATTNRQLEGDVTSVNAVVPTVRVGNYMQIASKAASVSGTLEALDKAGRKSEMAYQVLRRGLEIKRDNESNVIGSNQGGNAGSDTTARQTATMAAWLKTNTVKDSTDGGADPVYTAGVPSAARTDATATLTITKAMVDAAQLAAYTAGGNPSILMVHPSVKPTVSAFTSLATNFYDVGRDPRATAIIGSANAYLGEFGLLHIIPNRLQRSVDAWLLDPSFYNIEYLRPFHTKDLADVGDSTQKLVIVEYGLRVHNEAAHAGIFDIKK